jgi:hypothetical protein
MLGIKVSGKLYIVYNVLMAYYLMHDKSFGKNVATNTRENPPMGYATLHTAGLADF